MTMISIFLLKMRRYLRIFSCLAAVFKFYNKVYFLHDERGFTDFFVYCNIEGYLKESIGIRYAGCDTV